MKFKYKIMLGFFSCIFCFLVMLFYMFHKFEQITEKNIKDNSKRMASDLIEKMDQNIYSKIELLREFVETSPLVQEKLKISNANFAQKGDSQVIESFIDAQDRKWRKEAKQSSSPFINGYLSNSLSSLLRKKMGFYQEEYGYAIFGEIFLTNKYGVNVAMSHKTSDFRQNDEKWWQNGKAYGSWVSNLNYDDSARVYSINIILKIKDKKGNFIGVLKALLNIQEIYEMLKIYRKKVHFKNFHIELVDQKGRILYSPIRENFLKDISSQKAVKSILAGEKGIILEQVYDGFFFRAFERSHGYRSYRGLSWGIILNFSQKEILQKIASLRNQNLFALFVVIGFSLILTFVIVRSIVASIDKAKQMILDIVEGEGDLTKRLEIGAKDEMSNLAECFNLLLDKLQDTMKEIGSQSNSLSQPCDTLITISDSMSSNSKLLTEMSTSVSAAVEEISQNVSTVATGIEEMNSSIKEIARNASEGVHVTTSALHVAESTNSTIGALSQNSVEIGNVINVITSIAEQTNLLALNATIEAARAGESGKGFAVVANEVKELAKQTCSATDDIGAKIRNIQENVENSVKALAEITDTISSINNIQTVIAGAVEEQAATTSEISRNISEASIGTSEIAKSITEVSGVAKTSNARAKDTQISASTLVNMTKVLQKEVNKFKF